MRLELYADRVIDRLRAELSGRIVDLNAETIDFDIDPVANDAYYYGVKTEIWEYPAIEVVAPDADLTKFGLQQLDVDVDPTVIVAVWFQNTDSNRLWRSLDRYQHCVGQVLMQPNAFGASVTIERMAIRSARVNPETREAEQVTGAALHVYQLNDIERRPV